MRVRIKVESGACRPACQLCDRGINRQFMGLGAGDGTRTRDSLLGGQGLYQLSYSRVRTTRFFVRQKLWAAGGIALPG